MGDTLVNGVTCKTQFIISLDDDSEDEQTNVNPFAPKDVIVFNVEDESNDENIAVNVEHMSAQSLTLDDQTTNREVNVSASDCDDVNGKSDDNIEANEVIEVDDESNDANVEKCVQQINCDQSLAQEKQTINREELMASNVKSDVNCKSDDNIRSKEVIIFNVDDDSNDANVEKSVDQINSDQILAQKKQTINREELMVSIAKSDANSKSDDIMDIVNDNNQSELLDKQTDHQLNNEINIDESHSEHLKSIETESAEDVMHLAEASDDELKKLIDDTEDESQDCMILENITHLIHNAVNNNDNNNVNNDNLVNDNDVNDNNDYNEDISDNNVDQRGKENNNLQTNNEEIEIIEESDQSQSTPHREIIDIIEDEDDNDCVIIKDLASNRSNNNRTATNGLQSGVTNQTMSSDSQLRITSPYLPFISEPSTSTRLRHKRSFRKSFDTHDTRGSYRDSNFAADFRNNANEALNGERDNAYSQSTASSSHSQHTNESPNGELLNLLRHSSVSSGFTRSRHYPFSSETTNSFRHSTLYPYNRSQSLNSERLNWFRYKSNLNRDPRNEFRWYSYFI